MWETQQTGEQGNSHTPSKAIFILIDKTQGRMDVSVDGWEVVRERKVWSIRTHLHRHSHPPDCMMFQWIFTWSFVYFAMIGGISRWNKILKNTISNEVWLVKWHLLVLMLFYILIFYRLEFISNLQCISWIHTCWRVIASV